MKHKQKQLRGAAVCLFAWRTHARSQGRKSFQKFPLFFAKKQTTFSFRVCKEIPNAPLCLPQESVPLVLSSYLPPSYSSTSPSLARSLFFCFSSLPDVAQEERAPIRARANRKRSFPPYLFFFPTAGRERESVTKGCVSIRPGVSSDCSGGHGRSLINFKPSFIHHQ